MQKVVNTEKKKEKKHLGGGNENRRWFDNDLIQIAMFLLETEAD